MKMIFIKKKIIQKKKVKNSKKLIDNFFSVFYCEVDQRNYIHRRKRYVKKLK